MPMVTDDEKFRLPVVKKVKKFKLQKARKVLKFSIAIIHVKIEERDIRGYLPAGYEELLDDVKRKIFDELFTYNKKIKFIKLILHIIK